MPGLFGGGGNNNSTTTGGAPVNVPITPIAPPWMKNWKDTTTTNAPGQLEGLSRDMAGGGFGTAPDDLKWLQSFYKPAQTSVYVPPVAPVGPIVNPKVPVTPTPKVPVTPTTQMTVVDGKLKPTWMLGPNTPVDPKMAVVDGKLKPISMMGANTPTNPNMVVINGQLKPTWMTSAQTAGTTIKPVQARGSSGRNSR